MKKLMRIALVFALAGATLMYTGCTKDYSGDISDLNKKVSENATAISALQTQVAAAQTSANDALASAQNALKEAQEAAKAAAAANNDEEVAALTAKVATIEGQIADLEAKVKALDGLEAKLNEVAEQLKKDVDAKVDAALEEIRAELEKAIAQVEGNFSIEAAAEYTVSYSVAKWNPSTKTRQKEIFDKVAEAFPEIAEIAKGTEVEMFGKLPFIVNPSTVEFDDTYTFSLVNERGKNSGVVLGNPTPGFARKSGNNIWNVEVKSCPLDAYGRPIKNTTPGHECGPYALVAETADGISAQTGLAYKVETSNTSADIDVSPVNGGGCDLLYANETETYDALNGVNKIFNVTGCSAYAFVIEAEDPADVEEFDITIDGSEITFHNLSSAGQKVLFNIYAVGVNGSAAKTKAYYNITRSIEPTAELADKDVTLGYNSAKTGNARYDVAVKYNVADFEFTPLEWKKIWQDGMSEGGYAVLTNNDEDANEHTPITLTFFGSNGGELNRLTASYNDVKAFGFYVNSTVYEPGEYTVEIMDKNLVFYGVGNLTIANPEACPIKLAEALCDENGVLQIIGTANTNNNVITYDIFVSKALVYKTEEAKPVSFYDVDFEETGDGHPWVNPNGVFAIPTWNKPWAGENNKQKLLYTPRDLAVNFGWFGNTANVGTFEFKAQAVSPVWTADGANFTLNEDFVSTIFYTDDPATQVDETTTSLNGAIAKVKFVAGELKNEYEISGGKDVEYKWVESTTKIPDISRSPKYVERSEKIDHSNITGEGTRRLLLKNDGSLLTISLEDAWAAGFVTDPVEYEEWKKDDKFTYYLSWNNWSNIQTAWTTLFTYGYKYAGKRVGSGVNDNSTEDAVNTGITSAENSYKDLQNPAKARVDLFEKVIGQILYDDKILEKVTPASAAASDITPSELAALPYFTCANPERYFAYVIFNKVEDNNANVTKDTQITTIHAHLTAAGMKTVEIPLTAHVADKWGMTTEFTVKVTVKVK